MTNNLKNSLISTARITTAAHVGNKLARAYKANPAEQQEGLSRFDLRPETWYGLYEKVKADQAAEDARHWDQRLADAPAFAEEVLAEAKVGKQGAN